MRLRYEKRDFWGICLLGSVADRMSCIEIKFDLTAAMGRDEMKFALGGGDLTAE